MLGCPRWCAARLDEEEAWKIKAKSEHQVQEHLLVPAHPDRAAAMGDSAKLADSSCRCCRSMRVSAGFPASAASFLRVAPFSLATISDESPIIQLFCHFCHFMNALLVGSDYRGRTVMGFE